MQNTNIPYLKQLLLICGIIFITCKTGFSQAQSWLTNGDSVGGSAFLGTTNNEPLLFEVNSHQAMVILANGDIGIGTSDPHYALQIVGDVVDSGNFFATNIATSNSISVGQFKIVDGVVDSIVSSSGTLQLSAATVNADGAFNAAQTLTAGTSDTAITINGTTGTITSPLQTISFGNDTITTTGAVKAGSFITNKLTVNDTMTIPVVRAHRIALFPGDSLVKLGDSSFVFDLNDNNIFTESGSCMLCNSCFPPPPPCQIVGIALGYPNFLGGSSPYQTPSIAVGQYNNVTSGIALGIGNNVSTAGIAIGSTNVISGGGFITFGAGLTNTINGAILMGNSISNKPAISIIPDPTGNTAGNVGIGTTTPASALDVNSPNPYAGQIANFRNSKNNPSSDVFITSNMSGNGDWNNLTIAGDNGIFWSDGGSGGANSTSGFVIAPWSHSSAGIRIDASGNVGIGTPVPQGQLDIENTNPTQGVIVWGNGTTNTQSFANNMLDNDQGGSIELGAWGNYSSGGSNTIANTINPIANGTPYIDFHYGNGVAQDYNARIINDFDGEMDFYVDNNSLNGGGNLIMALIENISGSYVRAQEIRICQYGSCDFVFDKGYKLMPLNELENYLQLNHHLPGIPSAEEMQGEDGVDIGKMNSKLLQKVEELTLYTIELKEQLDTMQAEINKMKTSK